MIRWALAGLLALAAPLGAAHAQDWNLTFETTERGQRVGNPDASLHLIEFVSYTCPHCAAFEAESDAAMRMLYLHEGRANVEIRSVIRNPIDLAATLLAQCGAPENFFGNHRALMFTHPEWMAQAQAASEVQMQRWTNGPFPARMRSIAQDLGFHELMEQRGYSRVEIDQCLADQEKTLAIVEAHEANNADFEISGTPSFAINGQMLVGIHNWAALQQAFNDPAFLDSEGE